MAIFEIREYVVIGGSGRVKVTGYIKTNKTLLELTRESIGMKKGRNYREITRKKYLSLKRKAEDELAMFNLDIK